MLFHTPIGYSLSESSTVLRISMLRYLIGHCGAGRRSVARYDVGLNTDGRIVALVTPKIELFHRHTANMVPSYDPCPENKWYTGYVLWA
jgi:hypothetical protein